MQSRLIVMLTHHDKTVSEAVEVFNSCSDLAIEHWGFKDIGLVPKEMTKLVHLMRKAGKKTFLEVVSYSENDCMRGAKLAVEMGFDYLMGTIYYSSVMDFLSAQTIQYLPFCGNVHNSPSVLDGSIEEIISDAKKLLDMGVFGIDLLAFRHTNGQELASTYCQEIHEPVVIAGSINSQARIDFVNSINPWGFTMGSALFEKKFAPEGDFRTNLIKVSEYMNSLQ